MLKINTEDANPKNITIFDIGPNGIKVNFNDYARDVVIKKKEKSLILIMILIIEKKIIHFLESIEINQRLI